MRLRSPLREFLRRKGFGATLGPGIPRPSGNDPPPPLWGGARGPSSPPRAPPLAGQSALGTNFPNSLRRLSAASPPASLAWLGAGAQGEARAGSRAVFCRSRAEPAAAREGTEPLEPPLPAAAPAGPPPRARAPPGWGAAGAWASRGPASACSWPRCSFCPGRRPVSREGGDGTQGAGAGEAPEDGVESGTGGVRRGVRVARGYGVAFGRERPTLGDLWV